MLHITIKALSALSYSFEYAHSWVHIVIWLLYLFTDAYLGWFQSFVISNNAATILHIKFKRISKKNPKGGIARSKSSYTYYLMYSTKCLLNLPYQFTSSTNSVKELLFHILVIIKYFKLSGLSIYYMKNWFTLNFNLYFI